MKLIVKCKECRSEILTPNKASSRINYVQEYGEEIDLTCNQCNKSNIYEVDDIKAVNYSFGEILRNRILVFIVVLLVTFALGFFLVGTTAGILMGVVSSLIYALIAKKNDSKSNLTFNKHKVKGRMTNIGS